MCPATITHLESRRPRASKGAALPTSGRVADVIDGTAVRVPSWFTAAQACQVASLKRVHHLLVEERGQVAGTVAVTALARAAATDPVARWMVRSPSTSRPKLRSRRRGG